MLELTLISADPGLCDF